MSQGNCYLLYISSLLTIHLLFSLDWLVPSSPRGKLCLKIYSPIQPVFLFLHLQVSSRMVWPKRFLLSFVVLTYYTSIYYSWCGRTNEAIIYWFYHLQSFSLVTNFNAMNANHVSNSFNLQVDGRKIWWRESMLEPK